MSYARVYPTATGLVPRVQRRLYNEAVLVKARNVNLRHGDIRPWPCPTQVCEHDFEIKQLYETDQCKCVAFDECLEIVFFPLSNRAGCEYVIWAGPEQSPRIATVDDFCQGISCPLGLDCPDTPVITSWTPGSDDCNCVLTSYVVTYLDKYGRESMPSKATNPVYTAETGEVCLDLPMPDQPCITEIVVYRAFVGYKTGNEERTVDQVSYHKVAVLPADTASYCDRDGFNRGDAMLVSTGWFKPPKIDGVALLHSGALVGWHNRTLYFTEPNLTQAWTRTRDLVIDEKIKKVVPYGDDFFVLTEGRPYFVSSRLEEDGYWYQWTELPEKLPLVSDKGCTVNADGVFYISKYGLVHLYRDRNNTVATMLSRQWFDNDDWCKLNPENACLAAWDGSLFIFNVDHPTENRKTGYIFNYPNQRYGEQGSLTEYDHITPQACYCTPDGRLLMAEGGKVYEWNPCGATSEGCGQCCPYEIQYSSPFMRSRGRWNAALLYLREGSVTFSYRVDDCKGDCPGTWTVCEVADCDPFWLKSQGLGKDFEVKLEGCGIVEGAILATSKVDLARGLTDQ